MPFDPYLDIGYQCSGSQQLDAQGTPVHGDSKEAFCATNNALMTGYVAPPGADVFAGSTLYTPPVPGHATTCSEYTAASAALNDKLNGLLFDALGVDDTERARLASRPFMVLKQMRYAGDPSDVAAGRLGAGAHADWGAFTLLATDMTPGLQVQMDGNWLPVPPKPGCLIINSGDQIAQLTNDAYRSAVHRVVTQSSQPRLSTAVFTYFNLEATVAPLSRFVTAETPARHPSGRTTLEYFHFKLHESMDRGGYNAMSSASASHPAPAPGLCGSGAGFVDLSLWTSDHDTLVAQVAAAATQSGFLQVYNHGMPQEVIDSAFAAAEKLFALPDEIKGRTPFAGWAGGWEKEAQVRPSTGTADLKESFQFGYTSSCAWPAEADAPGLRATLTQFMAAAHAVSAVLLRALALALHMPETFLLDEHDPIAPDVQTALRLLHYMPLTGRGQGDIAGRWRAGAHTDFDVLTLLFQRPGQAGLEICPAPGKSDASDADIWVPVPPSPGCITCNLGDMLALWTGNAVTSTRHRVRAPPGGSAQAQQPRFSIAYFNQAKASTLIRAPRDDLPALTGRQFMEQAIGRNFAALAARKALLASQKSVK